MDLAKLAFVLVSWHKARIGSFDISEEAHVQGGGWNAELDDDISPFNSVTGSALGWCCSDGLAGESLGLCVALLPGDGIVLIEESPYLVLRQRGNIWRHRVDGLSCSRVSVGD